MVTLLVVGLVTAPGAAQIVAVGPESDPTTPGRTWREASPWLHAEGFALTSDLVEGTEKVGLLQLVDAGLAPAGSVHHTPGWTRAVGETTYLVRRGEGGGHHVRVDLAHDEVLDSVGIADSYDGQWYARGDDYFFLRDVASTPPTRVTFWPHASAAEAAITETAPGFRDITSMSCSATRCAVVLTGASELAVAEVGLSGPSIFGPVVTVPHDFGPYGSARIWALDDGWVLVGDPSHDATMVFLDAAFAIVSAVSYAGIPSTCAGDFCLVSAAVDSMIQRVTSSATTVLSTGPPPIGMTASWVCRARGCLSFGRPVGLDTTTGALVAVADDVWGRGATQHGVGLQPHTILEGGPIVTFADERFGGLGGMALASGPPTDPLAAPPFAIAEAPHGALGMVPFNRATVYDAALHPVADVTLPATMLGCERAFTWSGDRWAVACLDAGQLRVVTVDSSGIVSPLRTLASGAWPAAMSSAAGQLLVRTHAEPSFEAWLFGADPARAAMRIDIPFTRAVPAPGGFLVAGIGGADQLMAALLREDGTSHDLLRSLTHTDASDHWSVAFDGTYVVAAWTDNDGVHFAPRLAWFTLEGNLAQEVSVAPFADTEDIAVGSDGHGQTWVAYTRFVNDVEYLARRVRIRALSTGDALGGSCADGASCGSGVCSTGICCSAPCDGPCDVCTRALGAPADGICSDLCPDLDADVGPDAGGLDADAVDGGGDIVDAASGDAETSADAMPRGAAETPSGCSCSAPGRRRDPVGGTSAVWLAMLVSVYAGERHRRRHDR